MRFAVKPGSTCTATFSCLCFELESFNVRFNLSEQLSHIISPYSNRGGFIKVIYKFKCNKFGGTKKSSLSGFAIMMILYGINFGQNETLAFISRNMVVVDIAERKVSEVWFDRFSGKCKNFCLRSFEEVKSSFLTSYELSGHCCQVELHFFGFHDVLIRIGDPCTKRNLYFLDTA